jgi:hypothetical protein
MDNFKKNIISFCTAILDEGISPLLDYKNNTAFIIDPILGLNRNRVNAEILKYVIRLKKAGFGCELTSYIDQMTEWILS